MVSVYAGLTSCRSKDTRSLTGTWYVYKAFRNKQPADNLEGIFITLSEDKTVKSNFSSTGDTLLGQWKFNDGLLTITLNGDEPLEFEIEDLSDSTWTGQTYWHRFSFDVRMKKK